MQTRYVFAACMVHSAGHTSTSRILSCLPQYFVPLVGVAQVLLGFGLEQRDSPHPGRLVLVASLGPCRGVDCSALLLPCITPSCDVKVTLNFYIFILEVFGLSKKAYKFCITY